MNVDAEPLAHCVDDACADAVQTAGDLIAPAAEFAACVQHGENDLKRTLPRLLLNVHGDASAVVPDAYHVALLDDYLDAAAIARKRLVYGVVDDLVHKVVQTRRRGRAYIHARTLSYRLKPFKHLYL